MASFAGAYQLAESERQREIHTMFGYTVLGLVAFRLVWGFVGTRYARFASFLHGPSATLRYLRSLASGRPDHHLGHNPAGSWAIWAILGLAAATGLTGYLTYNDLGGEIVEELHEGMANAWLVVVFVHVAGVIVSSVLHRENLARAMVSGYKQAAGSDATETVPSRRVIGVLGALAVGGFWVVSLLAGGATGATGARGADDASTADGADSRQFSMAGERDDDDD